MPKYLIDIKALNSDNQMPIHVIKPFLKAIIHCSKYPNILRLDTSKVMGNG